MESAFDRQQLTEELVIGSGGWSERYARVIAIAEDGDHAFVLVDGNGDGAELEGELWERGPQGWICDVTGGQGPLDSLPTTIWNAGPIVCALGRGRIGDAVQVTWKGSVRRCEINRFGVWSFVRETDGWFSVLPQVTE
jgi:hypothetical protein